MASLDGIRAIAIIAVLIFHVSPSALKGGFTGVDVFFVLSGFLITSIILHDIREGSFSIREFYLRRIQRLLPNMVVMVLATLLLWSLLLPSSMASQTGKHGLYTLFNLSNIYTWRNIGNYWDGTAERSPLTHTWSLGIEEQFYILFPVSLLLLVRFQPKWVRFWLMIAAALSFGICLYGTSNHPTATFYLLPTRVWELLLGAILATHRIPLTGERSQLGILLSAKIMEAISWVGIGLVIMGFLIVNADNAFLGLASLVPTVGTGFLILTVANRETCVSRILSLPFMVATGKISYSIYLWHWPLIVLGKIQADFYHLPQFVGAVTGGLVSILLAWLAYTYIERPLRNRGPGRLWRGATITIGFSVVAIYCGFVAFRSWGIDWVSRFATPICSSSLFDANLAPLGKLNENTLHRDMHFPPLPPRSKDAWRTGGIIHLHGGDRPRVVVFGSSHALMYSKLIDDLCREKRISVAFLGVARTPAFFETKVHRNSNFPTPFRAQEFDEARRKWLREWRPSALFVLDRWDHWNQDCTPQEFDVKLRSFLEEVSPLADHVILATQVPVLEWGAALNPREFATWRMSKWNDLARCMPDSKERLRQQFHTVMIRAMADFQNLRVLRTDLPFYQKDGSIRYASGRAFFYADDDHLTDMGAEEVRPLFHKAIAEAHATFTSP